MKLPFIVPKTMPMEQVFEAIVRDCANVAESVTAHTSLQTEDSYRCASYTKRQILLRYGLEPEGKK